MTCPDIAPNLVPYHFGEISTEARDEVEAHLLSCPDCLADFLALKRQVETAELDERPSEAARLRLRHAIARELHIDPAPRPWSWWERPLAFGFAGAALAAAAMMVGVITAGEGTAPRSLAVDVPTMAEDAVPSP
ncbi:MAG: zf-HC2 domain-containing protein [Deltaproteobacteria bacterium]|nr:zf-HC2 domain-containing protein [Deltaproteobacteria bacterium]